MGAIREIRCANYFSSLINPVSGAYVAAKSSKVGEHTALPDKRVIGGITGEIRETDYLPAVIDSIRKANRAAQGAKINNSTCGPEEWVSCRNHCRRVLNIVGERHSSYLPTVINGESSGVRPA
jgi:hypothetical protein